MTLEVLEKIFGGAGKVKIMRLFLFNQSNIYDLKDVALRAKVSKAEAKRNLTMLEKADFLKKKPFTKETKVEKKGKEIVKKQKTVGWHLNQNFYYIIPLQNLLVHINPMKHKEIVDRIARVGKVKLIVISGVFINELESRVDLLVVGDEIKKIALQNVVNGIEAEIGKELRYSVFDTEDFQYRIAVYDKLIRDILDYPHEKVLDKLMVR